MATLEMIADAKIHAAAVRIVESLSHDVRALRAKNSAKGLLPSGAPVKQTIRVCVSAIDSLRDEITTQYAWVVAESISLRSSELEGMIHRAREHLAPLLEAAQAHLATTPAIVSSPELMPRCLGDLTRARARVWSEISIAMEGRFAERKRLWLRSVLKSFGSLAAKALSFFRGGA